AQPPPHSGLSPLPSCAPRAPGSLQLCAPVPAASCGAGAGTEPAEMPPVLGGAAVPGLLLLLLLLLSASGVTDEQTELPPFSATGGLHSVLEDTVSPAFSATVIIIVTVILSGSAYLCFLKYICSGCCKSTQVEPVRRVDPSRSEEQV
ncbi:hypothetical protein KIL84_018630, partial [Mauremys mutica]